MKKQNTIQMITFVSGLFLILIFSGTAAAQDHPCDSPRGYCIGSGTIGLIAPGFVVNSSPFNVTNKGNLYVQVGIKTYNNNVGSSKYKISLFRGTPSVNPLTESGTEVASKEVIVGSTAKHVTFSTDITSCNQTGKYYIRIKNTSTDNPQMGQVTILHYDFPPLVTKTLDMEGTTVSLDPGNESTRTIGSFTKPGDVKLKAKWHVPGIIPTYAKLKISVLRPDGSVVSAAKDYYSYHYKEGNPKFEITLFIAGTNVVTGEWKLKIINNSEHRIEGFNIRKEGDPNPFVPEFKSTFTNGCGQ